MCQSTTIQVASEAWVATFFASTSAVCKLFHLLTYQVILTVFLFGSITKLESLDILTDFGLDTFTFKELSAEENISDFPVFTTSLKTGDSPVANNSHVLEYSSQNVAASFADFSADIPKAGSPNISTNHSHANTA